MSERTKISWCDSTLNFWEGCTKVSPGCANCYAEARDKRFTGGKLWGKGAPRRKSKSAVKDALAFNRKPWICDNCGEAHDFGLIGANGKPTSHCRNKHGYEHQGEFHRRRIFSLSLGDWLDDEVPIEWLAEMLDTIRQCSDVTWMLCSKRPENFFKRMEAAWKSIVGENQPLTDWIRRWAMDGKAPSNIVLLASVENQAMADKRIPELLKIPAACRGLSLEPLLGSVNLIGPGACHLYGPEPRLDWLIIGGESGPNARPCNEGWIRNLVEQGQAAGVAIFVKQLGADPRHDTSGISAINGREIDIQNAPMNLRDKKGGDPAEWPADLRIQQWPAGF